MRIGIIGGGPGGSVTAAALARRGHTVILWERERFPRFHIGESLLPCNLPIYQELGLDVAAFQTHGFIAKHGAFFEQAGSGRTARYPFADGLGDPPAIFQVERSRFDEFLLNHAVASGVELRCPVAVDRVDFSGPRPVVHVAAAELTPLATEVDMVVDASGRDTLLARQHGTIDRLGDLKRAAVFGHVGALPLAPGAHPGDIVISRADAGWSWQIPLTADKWSVGLVLKREAVESGGPPADVFRAHLHLFPEVAARLAGQVPEPVRAIPNISYRVTARHGANWALVGDAGGFIDPIFSSGVLLATRAGWRLAQAIDAGTPLSEWAAATEADLATFVAFIRLWYDGHFIDHLFFGGVRDPAIVRGITSLLAGNTTNPDNQFLAMLQRRMSSAS